MNRLRCDCGTDLSAWSNRIDLSLTNAGSSAARQASTSACWYHSKSRLERFKKQREKISGIPVRGAGSHSIGEFDSRGLGGQMPAFERVAVDISSVHLRRSSEPADLHSATALTEHRGASRG